MPKVKITNTFVRTVKLPSKAKEVYSDIEEIGFVLEVRCTGTKTFYYRHTQDGKTKQKKIATTENMNANQARAIVLKLKKQKFEGETISLYPTPKKNVIMKLMVHKNLQLIIITI